MSNQLMPKKMRTPLISSKERTREMNDKYSNLDERTMFGFLANGIGGKFGEDRGQTFPYSDAEDMRRGLRFIPGEVTVARREGKRVLFNQPCEHHCCWFWQFPDGSRTYYWDRGDYEWIARANGKAKDDNGNYEDGVGNCPACGNAHTSGGHIEAAALKG
jgi:hypothetical protein